MRQEAGSVLLLGVVGKAFMKGNIWSENERNEP